MEIKDIYSELTCALMHDIRVCNECGKCEGEDGIEIRMKLVEKLASCAGMPKPWADEVK